MRKFVLFFFSFNIIFGFLFSICLQDPLPAKLSRIANADSKGKSLTESIKESFKK